MTNWFIPGIALMARLRFPLKFSLLGLVPLLAVALQYAVLQRNFDSIIEPSRQELRGIELIQRATRIKQNMQLHRDLSAGLRSESANERFLTVEQAITQQLGELNGVIDESLKQDRNWRSTQQQWQEILAEKSQISDQSNVIRHTEMIAALQVFTVTIGDASALTLDPDVDSYYVMLNALEATPDLLERLSQTRAKGVTLSASDTRSDQLAVLPLLLSEIKSSRRDVVENNDKTIHKTPTTAVMLSEPLQKLSTDIDRLAPYLKSDGQNQLQAVGSQKFFNDMSVVIDHGYALISDAMLPQLRELIEQRIAKQEQALMWSRILALGVVAIFAYLAISAYLNVIGEIELINRSAATLAEGDFTQSSSLHLRDELNEVSVAFNNIGASVGNLIRHAMASAHQVADAAQTLAAASNQIEQSSQLQSSAATGMAAAVEQMTVNLSGVAHSAGAARTVSEESGRVSDQGLAVVDQTIDEMARIADIVRAASQMVESLDAQSQRISEIVTTISEIANQTNLLALNAAIEAARAGETGRGFAVVADEVRQLAGRTAQCTQQITEMVSTIRAGTENAVQSMHISVGSVASGVELSRQAGIAMTDIRSKAAAVVQVVNEMTYALQEQAGATRGVAEGVENIARMAGENYKAIGGSAKTAKELQKLASSLRAELETFRV